VNSLCLGIILYIAGHESGIEYLLTGRAIGMVQIMRYSAWFREVIQRSLSVFPFLSGPIFLVLTTMHIFVYLGIALWGGAIDPDELAQNENVGDLFYLNNFNSYAQGLVTIFNVIVVNDWHEIAK
jgi:two pore calcium channel protein